MFTLIIVHPDTLHMRGFKRQVSTVIAPALVWMSALYFRYCPISAGKTTVWNKMVRPYLWWRQLRLKTKTKFGSTMIVTLPDLVQAYIYFFGIWEPAITRHVQLRLKAGDVFIDVGANVGYYTLLASRLVGVTGEVYSIEASPTIYESLQRNVRANTASNVRCINMAASSEHALVPLYLHSESNRGATTTVPFMALSNSAEFKGMIAADTLENIVGRDVLCKASVIKIDVEGAEWSIIQSLEHVLGDMANDVEIIVEVTPTAIIDTGGSLESLLKIFQNAGFSASILPNRYDPEFYVSARYSMEASDVKLPLCQQADLLFRRL
jgi:FkbM family methyltransferase